MNGNSQTCKDCIHFYVTHAPNFPYGCRRMGFKCLRYPYYVVQEATGQPCEMRCVQGSHEVT